jgi:hypothetical protein
MVAGVALLALALVPSTTWSQVPQPVPQPVPVPGAPVDTGEPVPVLSMNQLQGLVAPIALYPDPLISQILVASTYPLEVVEAYQWLQQNPGLTGPALTQAAAAQNWDPSVQALVVFPDVLRRLNEDVNWTTSLGNAFLNQQTDVMAAIQQMRASAEQNGRLSSTPQQQVVTTVDNGQPVVEILPTNPEVIYVPVYDPVWVWGPPIYYPYAHWYYPPVRSGLFFSVGIGIGGFFGHGWGGWGGWGWHPAWGSRTVIVNNTFIRENPFNVTHVANVGRTSVWAHDSFHRQGVPYPNQALNQRYAGNFRQNTFARQNAFAPRSASPVQAPVRSFAQNNRSGQMAMSNPAPRQNFRAPRQNFQNFNAPRQNFSQPRQNFNQVPQARFENRQVAPQIQNRGNFNAFQGGNSARMHADRSFSSPAQARSFAAPARESHAQSRGGNGGGGGGGRSHGR